MLATLEKVILPTESCFKSIYRSDKKFEVFWHYHPEFEITLILNGQGQRIIGDDMANYSGPQLHLIPPNIPHSCQSENEDGLQNAYVIQFDLHCLGEGFFDSADFEGLDELFSNAWSFPSETIAPAKLIMKSIHESHGILRIIKLLELLKLLKESDRKAISQSSPHLQINESIQSKMNIVFGHLSKKEALCIPNLANSLGMSESTLRRFFKKHTGRSIIDFHNEMKINAACLLLQSNPDISISEVSQNSGFNNLSHFNRQFKRWKKCQPKEYRSRYS